MKVVSNSGLLMALAKINQIHLLFPLYGTVIIPSAVYDETVRDGLARGEPDALLIELAVQRQQLHIVSMAENDLSVEISTLALDRGEKHAIQLAKRENADWVLLDDTAAREEAKRLGLPMKGTLGVFVDAVRRKVLSFAEAELVFEAIIKREDIWIAEGLVRRVWKELKKKAS